MNTLIAISESTSHTSAVNNPMHYSVFINWFQIGVIHHKNEECSNNENRMCSFLRRVLELVDFIILSAQIDHMLPVVDSHCVAKTTTPYINYLAGKITSLIS